MSLHVSLTPESFRNLERINALFVGIKNLEWLLDQIGQTVVSHIDLGFRNSEDPYGTPWAPLSPVTELNRRKGVAGRNKRTGKRNRLNTKKVARAVKAGKTSQILKDTGVLANSFNYDLYGNIYQGRGTVIIGSTDIKAVTHQFGASKGQYGKGVPWGDIPVRKMIPDESGLPVEIEDEIAEITQEFLLRVLRS